MESLNQNAWSESLDGTQQTQPPTDTSQPTATLQQPQSWQEAMVNMLNGFGTWVLNANQSQAATTMTMQALVVQINVLVTQAPTTIHSMSAAPSSTAPSGSIRVKEPCQFTGKASDVEAFLDEITNYMYLQRRQIMTDYKWSLLFSLYLANGNPKLWCQAIHNLSPEKLNDFDGLVEDFRHHFSDSDLESMAYRNIKALRQTGLCAAYALHFRKLVVYLDWTDKSKITAFKEGLKDQVHDLLVMVHPKPTIFDNFVKICIEFDNAVHENELDKCHTKSGSDALKSTNCSHPKQIQSNLQPVATSASLSMPVLLPGEPMSIDATKTKCGPLMQAKRNCCCTNKLCMYCGGQHQIDSCPNMLDAAKKRFTDKKITSSSLGKA